MHWLKTTEKKNILTGKSITFDWWEYSPELEYQNYIPIQYV